MSSQRKIDITFEKGMENAISNPEKSYETGEDLLAICKKKDDNHGKAKSYLLLSYAGQFLGLHAQSYEYVNLSIPMFIEFNDLKNQASAYNTLGFVYYYFDDHNNRLEVNLKSLNLRKKIKDHDGIMRSLNNTGDTYLKLGKYKEALNHFDECLSLSKSNKRMKAVVTSNITEANLYLKNHESALEYVAESFKYAYELKLYDLILYNFYLKSHIYNDLGNWDNSIKQLHAARELTSKEITYDESNMKDLYKSSSLAYEKIGDFVNSLKSLKKHFEIDKIIQERKQKKEIKSILFRKEIAFLQNKTSELEITVDIRTKELEQALEAEKHISYFTQELTNTNTLDEVCWKLVKSCISKLDLEDCVVYLLDEDKDILFQKAAFGPKSSSDEKIENPITIRIGDGIVGSVAKYGKLEIIDDTSKDMRYIVDDDIRYSELAVPIFYEKKVIGVIDSEHSEKNFFNDRHVSIFTMLSSLVQSRIGKLREQEAKQILQEKIININESLEKQIRIKSKENTQLNHKILEQEKKAIIGEMSTIITHELNTPLATIKGGNEAMLFLFNKLLNSGFVDFITKDEIDFIIEKSNFIGIHLKKKKSNLSRKKLNAQDLKRLECKIQDKSIFEILEKLGITDSDEISKILEFKNIEFTLTLLKDIQTINDFSDVILKSVARATNVVEELKSLAQYDDNPEKRKIVLANNFEGLQVHISLSQPKAKFNFKVHQDHHIYGNEFRTIQLWSNIIHLIIDNCDFKNSPEFTVTSEIIKNQTLINIECQPNIILTDFFNKNILNYRFQDDIEGSEKLKLNIIQTILIEHRAKMKCELNDENLLFQLRF